MHVEVRRQLSGVVSLLPPCGPGNKTEAWWQVPSPIDPSRCYKLFSFLCWRRRLGPLVCDASAPLSETPALASIASNTVEAGH